MLGFADLFTQVRIMSALWVDSDGIRPVVELMNHAALIHGQVKNVSLLPSTNFDRVESVGIKLGRGSEVVRVVCHVEHSHVAHRPGADLVIAGAVDQDGVALVDAAGDVGVAAGCGRRGRCLCWG